MPKKPAPNLVLELKDTNIPHDLCKPSCKDRHYVVIRPGDYDKRKKTPKLGAVTLMFTLKAKDVKKLGTAIIEDAKSYQFKNA